MALRIPVQKDIGEYEEKIVGKMSLRTLACVSLGFGSRAEELLPLLAAHELSPQLLAYEPCLAGSLPEGSPRPGRPGRRARRRARKKGAELYEPSKKQQGE